MKLILAVISLTVFVTWMPLCNSFGGRTPRRHAHLCEPADCENQISAGCYKAGENCIHTDCAQVIDRNDCLRELEGHPDKFEETNMDECLGIPLRSSYYCGQNITAQPAINLS